MSDPSSPESRAPGATAKPTAPAGPGASSGQVRPGQLQPTTSPLPSSPNDVPMGVALSPEPGESGTVTARKAGGLRDMGLEVDTAKGRRPGRSSASGQGDQHRVSDRLWRKLPRVGLPGGDRAPGRGAHHPPRVLRIRRQLVRPVRPVDSLAATDARRPRPRFARGPAAHRRERAVDDPRNPEPDRTQARPGRRIRGPRAGLCRTDVRPARSLGNHPGWDRSQWEIWTTQIGLDIRIAPRPEVVAPAAPAS